MQYLSVCSGIEAASVAWHPLGWKPLAFSEIEKFPSAVLAHHWPDVPNLGDMTKHHEWPDTIRPDLLVGGTPCQSFSVAGLRKGLADPRGNLALVFLGILEQFRPRWVVWENVPGVRSSDDGGALGSFLGGLEELGYGWAYRSLDAQYFNLAQRRERVFVVGYLGDWRRAAAVLFEPESLRGDSAPKRKTREGTAISPSLRAQANSSHRADTQAFIPDVMTFDRQSSGEYGTEPVASTDSARDFKGASDLVTHSLTRRYDSSEDGCGRGTPLVPVSMYETGQGFWQSGAVAGTLRAEGENRPSRPSNVIGIPIAFSAKDHGADASEELSPTLRAGGSNTSHANSGNWMAVTEAMAVRRLTPRECERLQGFPDDHTLIPYNSKPAKDGPRYKALGNSMAVPVVRWIGRQIQAMEELSA